MAKVETTTKNDEAPVFVQPTYTLPESLVNVPIAELETAALLQALRANNWDKEVTAEKLGLAIRTVQYKAKALREKGYEIRGRGDK